MSGAAAVDVVLLTGFLGAGKTTLLNRLLTAAHGRRIAVIVNEFGETSIDHDLLLATDQQVVTMANGCVCCTVRGDLARALLELSHHRDEFDLVVIETTGLAEPGPVLQTFHADARLRTFCTLRGVVTMVDAKHGAQQIATMREPREQIAFADLIVLNKTDLAAADEVDAVERELHRINRFAPILRARNSDIDPMEILDLAHLANETVVPDECGPDCTEHHHHHHLDDIKTLSISTPGALHGLRLGAWLQSLALLSEPMLRIKGILNIWGDADQFLFQAVQNDCECRPGARWRDGEARINRIVFIGRALDEDALRAGFAACIADESEPCAALPDTFGRWHEDISPQRLDQIRFWMRQNFGFGKGVPILIKEVPCAKPQCPPVETAIVALLERAPPRLFKVQASINDLTFDHVYDLMENPMPCC